MFKTIATLAAVAAIIASGYVHGIWTERWGRSEAASQLAERVLDLPLRIGEWEGEDLPQKQTAYDKELAASVLRKYTHAVNGMTVTVAVLCGRPGPICIHTPDVCYDASGFKVGTRATVKVPGGNNEFWQADAVRERIHDTSRLRIFWAWNYGPGWQAAHDPRADFARQRALIKLYVVRDLAQPNEKVENDACVQFLQAFVTDGQAGLFSTGPME